MTVSVSFIVLFLLIVSAAYAFADDGWDHVIIVDGVTGTHNDTMCINGSLPCATLNMALKGIKDNSWYSVCIEIRPGNYTLEYGEENELYVSRYYHHASIIAIIGSGMSETVINCEPSAGLYIAKFYLVRIDSVSFHNCGYCCRGYSSELQAAVTVLSSSAATFIDTVAVYNSNGSGIFINSTYVIVTNSLITGGSNDGVNSASQIEGGIVTTVLNSESSVSIINCNITNNYYSTGAGVTIQFVAEYYFYEDEVIRSITIDSCFIMENNRGFHYAYRDCNDIAGVCRYQDTIIITNTHQVSSMNNTVSTIEMPDNASLYFHFTNVYISDSIIVNKTIDTGSNSLPCYGDALKVTESCMDDTCRFPQIDVKYFYTDGDNYDNYDNTEKRHGICSNNCISEYHKGHNCPIPYSVKFDNGMYSCWDNHQGELCGECIEGHSVAINSPYLACSPCNGKLAIIKGWGLLIAFEFFPIAVMVAVIAVLNVNLNQGSLKAYIFFCQILTISFPSVSYPSWFVISYNYDLRVMNIVPLSFLAIWNLEFISYPSCNILGDSNFKTVCKDHSSLCISHNTTALVAISFWYFIAFFPFILLLLLYICVLAYNRGFRCVVRIMRPIHRLLARFWCKFNIRPSLPHTIASVYTLCFTQLAATSLKLLHFTTYDNEFRFFYDGSQRYFSGWHGVAGTLALIVLVVFVIVPAVYLFVYPFMWFQKCLNKVKIKKDILISVTDVFTAPYSDGTQDTLDFRYYASSHFILQLLVMVLYYIPSPNYTPSAVILALQVCLCTLLVISLVVFRPYKRKIHVFSEALVLALLVVSNLTLLYIVRENDENLDTLHIISWLTFYPIFVMIFLFSFCFCCVWFSRKYNKRQRVTRRQQPKDTPDVSLIPADNEDNSVRDAPATTTNISNDDDAFFDDMVANPSYYRRWHDN